MSEEIGVKETKEALVGLIVLGAAVQRAAKKAKADGKIDWADAPIVIELASDQGLKKAVTDAVEGAEKIPAEIKDLSVVEGIEVVQAVIQAVQVEIAK